MYSTWGGGGGVTALFERDLLDTSSPPSNVAFSEQIFVLCCQANFLLKYLPKHSTLLQSTI